MAQILFMIWNALNDPLFGYLQDLGSAAWLRNRKLVILRGAPWWAISFMLPWIPFGRSTSPPWVVGLHLIVVLFVYDGLLSFMLLAHSALFAEVTNVHSERVRIIKYMQVMTLLGSLSLPFVNFVTSGLQNFFAFQIACLGIALLGYFCMWYTGTYAPQPANHISPDRHLNVEYCGWTDYIRYTKEIFFNRDFWSITLANFMHILRSTFLLNFTSIFTEELIPRIILPEGGWLISGLYALCTQGPQVHLILQLNASYSLCLIIYLKIVMIIGSQFVTRFGAHRVLTIGCLIDLAFGICAFAVGGADRPYLIIVFLVITR